MDDIDEELDVFFATELHLGDLVNMMGVASPCTTVVVYAARDHPIETERDIMNMTGVAVPVHGRGGFHVLRCPLPSLPLQGGRYTFPLPPLPLVNGPLRNKHFQFNSCFYHYKYI